MVTGSLTDEQSGNRNPEDLSNPDVSKSMDNIEERIIFLLDLQAEGINQINQLDQYPDEMSVDGIRPYTRKNLDLIHYLTLKQRECDALISDNASLEQVPPDKLGMYRAFNQIFGDIYAFQNEILLVNYGLTKVTQDLSKEHTDANFERLGEVCNHLKQAEKISRDMEVHQKSMDHATYMKVFGKELPDSDEPEGNFFEPVYHRYILIIDALSHLMVLETLSGEDLEREIKEQVKDLLHDLEELIPDFGPGQLREDSGSELEEILSGDPHDPMEDVEKLFGGGEGEKKLEKEFGIEFNTDSSTGFTPYAGNSGASGTKKPDPTPWYKAVSNFIRSHKSEGAIVVGAISGAATGGVAGAVAGAVAAAGGKSWIEKWIDKGCDAWDRFWGWITGNNKGKSDKSKSAGYGDGGRTDVESGQNYGKKLSDVKDKEAKPDYITGETRDKSPVDTYLKTRQEVAKWLITPGKTGDMDQGYEPGDSDLGEDTGTHAEEIQTVKDAEYTGKTGWDALPERMKMISHPVETYQKG